MTHADGAGQPDLRPAGGDRFAALQVANGDANVIGGVEMQNVGHGYLWGGPTACWNRTRRTVERELLPREFVPQAESGTGGRLGGMGTSRNDCPGRFTLPLRCRSA